MKVLIAGGGTAGHINPAIAVANTIKAHDKHAEIAFIGTAHGLENELVKKAGYPIYHIEMSGLQRSFSLRNIKTAYCYITAPIKAKKLIKKFGPDVVFGTGGYLSYPLIKAAGALGVPSALHESNALVGKAIQMLSGTVNKIYLNFESAAEQIRDKSKVEVVGNPLISESDVLPSAELKRKLGIPAGASITVLSFGGSLGSEKIADAVIATAKKFKEDGRSVYFVHSAGSRKYDSAYKKASESGMTGADNFRLEKYIYNMPEWEACADIVICRAGAMTLSE
ncbi:MAG: UDP-N-acetylglucosamine--N-acetylmuramyl-(pentapeptide) pyrophosphoryl-undecaprenol N-acetylglucosamine transferase, partial [Clostridiales bacterium]|nr:UDP-N-acetylglucosamine--N-acetylmuramyl-(pentapeptide) pyrophosphoryl-undecaprenol N-acetylglucosamine transferase [Clostridiales bacterium]